MAASTVKPARPKQKNQSQPKSSATKGTDGLGAESVSPQRAATVLTGFNGNRRVPAPINEPVKSYAPGSPERAALKARLKSMSKERVMC